MKIKTIIKYALGFFFPHLLLARYFWKEGNRAAAVSFILISIALGLLLAKF